MDRTPQSAWERVWSGPTATSLRARLAQVEGAPVRRAVSRLLDPMVAQRAPEPMERAFVLGPVRLNPSGTLTAGRRVLAKVPGARQTDWLAAAFPSPLRVEQSVMAMGYGPPADAITLLTELLPAALWLDERDPCAVILLGLPLARCNTVQEALAARLFGRRRVRPHAAHRVADAQGVWLPPAGEVAAMRGAAGARLAATFAPAQPAQPGEIVALSPKAHPATPALSAGFGADRVVDPLRDPLWQWAPRVAGARALLTVPGRFAALHALFPDAAHHTLAPGEQGMSAALAWHRSHR